MITDAQYFEMMGCTRKDMDNLIETSDRFGTDLRMTAMSILSDAQEMQERNYDNNTIRQMMNRAKMLLSESMDRDRAKAIAAA